MVAELAIYFSSQSSKLLAQLYPRLPRKKSVASGNSLGSGRRSSRSGTGMCILMHHDRPFRHDRPARPVELQIMEGQARSILIICPGPDEVYLRVCSRSSQFKRTTKSA